MAQQKRSRCPSLCSIILRSLVPALWYAANHDDILAYWMPVTASLVEPRLTRPVWHVQLGGCMELFMIKTGFYDK